MKVPEEIKVAAKDLIDAYGCQFSYLGERDGVGFYLFLFPDDVVDTGFPFVFEYKDGEVREISGFDSLNILGFFGEDAGEVCVE